MNTLRPEQNDCHFADNKFKCIFFKKILWISNKISLKCIVWRLNDNKWALVQLMAWCQANTWTDVDQDVWCHNNGVTRPQCVNKAKVETIWICKSLWPGNYIWWHRPGSTLAQVMACCMTAPSNYPNQSLRSCGIHPRLISQWIATILYDEFEMWQ